MQHYTLAFVFNTAQTEVLLIQKNRPAWQAGKLNAIGGKVEEGETVGVATCRELYEEAHVIVAPPELRGFAMLIGEDYKVYCAAVALDDERYALFQSMTDEPVLSWDYATIMAHMGGSTLSPWSRITAMTSCTPTSATIKHDADLAYLLPMAKLALNVRELHAAIAR
jgi:8-oxo-dGTP diphosphatase